jgi:hypothetical protein
METQQIMEMLKAMHAKADADRKADRELLIGRMEETIQHEMKGFLSYVDQKTQIELQTADVLYGIPADTTYEKTDPDQGMMQSTEGYQESTKKEAAVIPVKGRKKRRRARKPAAGRRGEPNELTRGDCGSGKKLAAVCKEITRRATVVWRKKNVFRKIVSQENCGPRSKLTAAEIMMTRHAGVAWPREKCVKNRLHQEPDRTRNTETKKRR